MLSLKKCKNWTKYHYNLCKEYCLIATVNIYVGECKQCIFCTHGFYLLGKDNEMNLCDGPQVYPYHLLVLNDIEELLLLRVYVAMCVIQVKG